jgi:hypothetical protein
MTTHALTPPKRRKLLGPALWAVQVLLALFFIFAGSTKLATPAAALAQQMPWTADYPGLVLWTGLADLLGGIGILLPALTRVLPGLTPLAATGLVALQVLALVFHLSRGEAAVAPLNLVLLALAAFVWWGRSRALPVAPRG